MARACLTKNNSKPSWSKHQRQPTQHRLSKTHALEEEEDAMLYNTSASSARAKALMVEPTINGTPIRMELDTESALSIIPNSTVTISAGCRSPQLQSFYKRTAHQTAWGHLCGRRVERSAPRWQGSHCEDRRTTTVWTRLASAHPNRLEPCASPRQQHCINTALASP